MYNKAKERRIRKKKIEIELNNSKLFVINKNINNVFISDDNDSKGDFVEDSLLITDSIYRDNNKGSSLKDENLIILSSDNANYIKDSLETKIEIKLCEKIKDLKFELELIDNEIFILSNNVSDSKSREKINEDRERIKEMLFTIEKIKEQLTIYENDNLIKDAIMLDDNNIMDDILDYKCLLNSKQSFKEDYEKLEDYVIICEKIDNIYERCKELDEFKSNKLEELNINDEQFKILEKQALENESSFDMFKESIMQQEKLIDSLESNIDIINMEESISYNYDLLNKLVSLELKFVAIMSVMPMKGSIPLLALSALYSRNILLLLSKGNLVREEIKCNYFAKDYSTEIENLSYKLDDIGYMLNESLDSIKFVKSNLINNSTLRKNSKYDELLFKINGVESFLNENISKVEIHKSKMKINKRRNDRKLEKILTLNQDS